MIVNAYIYETVIEISVFVLRINNEVDYGIYQNQ